MAAERTVRFVCDDGTRAYLRPDDPVVSKSKEVVLAGAVGHGDVVRIPGRDGYATRSQLRVFRVSYVVHATDAPPRGGTWNVERNASGDTRIPIEPGMRFEELEDDHGR
jgi:hypothetical protein